MCAGDDLVTGPSVHNLLTCTYTAKRLSRIIVKIQSHTDNAIVGTVHSAELQSARSANVYDWRSMRALYSMRALQIFRQLQAARSTQ